MIKYATGFAYAVMLRLLLQLTWVDSSLISRASTCSGSCRRKWNSGQKVWAWKEV